MKNKIDKIIFGIIIVILICIMFFYVSKKEGFHEDEMFSYGSSNYKYDNLYQPYGKEDSVNIFMREKILDKNIIQMIKNIKYYYFDNTSEKEEFIQNIQKEIHPVWKTAEEAKQYLTIGTEDIFNYGMVCYNQGRDVHPPLFYYVVHTVSILFFGTFSKYIIFIVNLGFFIGSCFVLRNIMKKLNKEHLSNLVVLLYGLSMGAISTVMYQRMYMTLTFFVLLYLFINLKIIKNNFEIDKKLWVQLGITTLLGFLTQYYFCIIAATLSLLIFVGICRKKETKKTISFIINYIKIALIGLIVFPISIQHIFFSYRGIGSAEDSSNFILLLKQNLQLICYAYSVPVIAACIIFIFMLIFGIYKKIKGKDKNIFIILFLTLPIIIYLLVVSKISPVMEYKYMIRYIACIIPIVAIDLILLFDYIFSNKKTSIVILIAVILTISINGFITSEPRYLFKGYSKYLDIANEYKNDNFVFIGDTVFNHIQSMPEFMTYKESLILNKNQIDNLVNNEGLVNKNEFILSIKKYLGSDELLKEVLLKSGFNSYELLYDDNGDVGCVIYKIIK